MKKYKIAAVLLSAVMALASCGGEYVGKVGSEKITKQEFEFYLSLVKQQMEGTELSSDEDWATKEIEGKKAISIAKERAFDNAADNLSYIQVAKKLGIKLTDDDQKKVDKYKQRVVSGYGGAEKYKSFLDERGISDSFIDMMCSSMIYMDKLYEKVANDTPATDAEISDYFKKHYRRAKHVLVMTVDSQTQVPYDQAKQDEAKKKAEEILMRAQSGEDFDSLIEQYNEDPGMKSNPDGYVFTDGVMVAEFTDGVDSLENGGITMVQTSYGYHVIKRLALDETPEYFASELEKNKQSIQYGVNSEKLEAQMDKWKADYKISVDKNDEVYDAIDS